MHQSEQAGRVSTPLLSPISRDDIAGLSLREGLVLEDEGRIGVLLADRSIDVQACPGSGKTTLVAAKLILLAKKWSAPGRGICVLSHTNVAKKEILDRVMRSRDRSVRALLGYPHFVGTIQEFIDKFLALPLLRSAGIADVTIDNDAFAAVAWKLLDQNQFMWLRGTMNSYRTPDDADGVLRQMYLLSADEGEVNISKRAGAWKKPEKFERAKKELARLKRAIEKRGHFLYRDMYTYAQFVASSNSAARRAIAVRFPYLFIDEMQDTQRFQDELLCSIFPRRDDACIVQRFGDPDQAIFGGVGNEEPNDTFNRKSAEEMDFVIHGTHRFDNSVSSMICKLSYNNVALQAELDEKSVSSRKKVCANGSAFQHTVFVFDDVSRCGVIKAFADHLSSQFTAAHLRSRDFCAKAIGAVGNQVDPTREQLKLGNYWPAYDKQKASGTAKPTSLIEAVRYCRSSSGCDWSTSYKVLMDSLLTLARLSGLTTGGGRYFSARTWRDHLESTGKWRYLRECVFLLLDSSYVIDAAAWRDIVDLLQNIYQLEKWPQVVEEYVAFSPEVGDRASDDNLVPISVARNMVRHSDGFSVEIATIHSVKGETHDATLVLETKNNSFDIGSMLSHLVGKCPNESQPNQKMGKRKTQFMRQLYVAMSRPKHLLCIAIHSARLDAADSSLLERMGWRVVHLDEAGRPNRFRSRLERPKES